LWLAYSWLDEQSLDNDVTALHAVRTHLARSDDDGESFTFVRAINAAEPAPGNVALVVHEVPSPARRGNVRGGFVFVLRSVPVRRAFHSTRLVSIPENRTL
jgi:hypothetical protein